MDSYWVAMGIPSESNRISVVKSREFTMKPWTFKLETEGPYKISEGSPRAGGRKNCSVFIDALANKRLSDLTNYKPENLCYSVDRSGPVL
jgi:hypothetical protein